MVVRLVTVSVKSKDRGCMTCRLLKASNWRVRLAARSAARTISWAATAV